MGLLAGWGGSGERQTCSFFVQPRGVGLKDFLGGGIRIPPG